MPTVRVSSNSNYIIANFDLNYDLSNSEIREAKEEDTSIPTYLTKLREYVALLYAISDCLCDENDEGYVFLMAPSKLQSSPSNLVRGSNARPVTQKVQN